MDIKERKRKAHIEVIYQSFNGKSIAEKEKNKLEGR